MLIQADARSIPLQDGCVQCVVTSPPYFGLRDYGNQKQIGLEKTPADYVASIVSVFREVRRVLKADGICWVNLGDSYAGSWGAQSREHAGKHAPNVSAISATQVKAAQIRESHTGSLGRTPGLKAKDLIGIPWRVAFALQADGSWLRSDVIWSKPNGMCESVTDRPTTSHEHLFLLAKNETYYYDANAIMEVGAVPAGTRAAKGSNVRSKLKDVNSRPPKYWDYTGMRNKRSVWTVATVPYAGAHFATMPEGLVLPCIRAGSRVGDIVLDPFIGSGTVGEVAERLDRRWVGLDLSPAYHRLAKRRTAQRGLKFEVA